MMPILEVVETPRVTYVKALDFLCLDYLIEDPDPLPGEWGYVRWVRLSEFENGPFKLEIFISLEDLL